MYPCSQVHVEVISVEDSPLVHWAHLAASPSRRLRVVPYLYLSRKVGISPGKKKPPVDASCVVQVQGGAFALSVAPTLVACACAGGVVRLFAVRTLAFKLNLPRLESGEGVPVASAGEAAAGAGGVPRSDGAAASFPDALACSFDPCGEQLAVMYADRSLVLWDVRSPAKVARLRCLMSHAGGIWGAVLTPTMSVPMECAAGAMTPAAEGAPQQQQQPQQQLVTCSSDGSIRIWGMGASAPPAAAAASTPTVNYSKNAQTLKGMLLASPAAGSGKKAAVVVAAASPGGRPLKALLPVAPSRPLKSLNLAGKGGPAAAAGAAAGGAGVLVRCLQLSPDGRLLAAGDHAGNLRVFDLHEMRLLAMREAHDSELLSMAFSPDGCFLATAGRDR